jgi:hypothetical protein
MKELEAQMKIDANNQTTVRETSEIQDCGKVRIGDMSPGFPPPRTTPLIAKDSGKVRMGDMSPSFPTVRTTPVIAKDGGKVRMGDMSPSFPPAR